MINLNTPKLGQRSKRKTKKKSKNCEYIRRQRVKAARIKARKARHRLKHKQKQMTHGMMVIFARYIIARVKLRELASSIPGKKKSNSKFSFVDMIVGLVALMAFGLPRVYDVAKYKEQRLLANALQMDRMFSPDTVYRFLKKFAMLTICRHLQKANSKMIREILANQEQIIVDGDWSTLRSYQNSKDGSIKGYNKLRPGRPCYQANVYFANELYIKADILAGNEVPLDSLTLFTDLQEVRRLCGRVDWIRLDAGYISWINLERLDSFSCQGHSRQKVKFVINVGSGTIGAKEAIRLSRFRAWQKVKRGVEIQEFQSLQIYKDYEQKHRLILVHRYFEQEKRWKYYALVTNDETMSSLELYRFYHQRQCIENFFDDAKNSYFIEQLPSQKLLGNSLYFNIMCLAFNLLVLFRHELLRKKDQWIQLRTLQKNYLLLEVFWDGQVLTVSRHMADYRVLLMIFRRLKKLDIPLEYRLCG